LTGFNTIFYNSDWAYFLLGRRVQAI